MFLYDSSAADLAAYSPMQTYISIYVKCLLTTVLFPFLFDRRLKVISPGKHTSNRHM